MDRNRIAKLMTQFYGVFDADGFPQGFYSDAAHSDIPDAAVPITRAQWQAFLGNQGSRALRNGQVVPATPTPPAPVPPVDVLAQRMASDPVFAALVEVVSDLTTTPNIEALIIAKIEGMRP